MKRNQIVCLAALLAMLASAAQAAVLPPLAGNIVLAAGEIYLVATRQNVAANTTITVSGNGRATIKGSTPDGELLYIRGSNVTISNIDFDGGGIYRDKFNGMVLDKLAINGCKLLNIHQGSHHRNGVNSLQCKGLTISRCLFDHVDSATWIGDESDVTITNNEIRECGYGIKVFGDGANRNWTVRYNWTHDCGPNVMAFELQGQCADWAIEYNLTERMRLANTWLGNTHALITSAPMAKSPGNGRVVGNVLLGVKPNGLIYYPMAHEVGGGTKGGPTETLYESNYVDGANVAFAVTDGDGAARIRFRNNFATNVNKVWNQNGSQELIFEGKNGGDAPPPSGFASWTAYIADLRTKVGPNGGVVIPPPPPTDEVPALKARIIELQNLLDRSQADLSAANSTIAAVKAELATAVARLAAIKQAGGF